MTDMPKIPNLSGMTGMPGMPGMSEWLAYRERLEYLVWLERSVFLVLSI